MPGCQLLDIFFHFDVLVHRNHMFPKTSCCSTRSFVQPVELIRFDKVCSLLQVCVFEVVCTAQSVCVTNIEIANNSPITSSAHGLVLGKPFEMLPHPASPCSVLPLATIQRICRFWFLIIFSCLVISSTSFILRSS